MFTRIACLTLVYAAATATFMTAAVTTRTEAPSMTMSSINLEKTNRANIGSPDQFALERFAS